MPYPSHHSKLPKPAPKPSIVPLDELEGNVDFGGTGSGLGVRANPPGNRLKRKFEEDMADARSIARRLDFGQKP